MKKLVTTLMIALSLSACSSSLTANGKTYDSYGLLNDEKKNPDVCYETNVGDVILGIIFVESIIVPVYTFGFDYKEPKHLKAKDGSCN